MLCLKNLFKISLISRRSDITLPPSRIHLFFTYPFWFGDIISGKTFLKCSVKVLEINFTSTLSKEIGHQFWIYLLSRPFFWSILLLLVFAMHWVVLQDSPFLLPVEKVPLLHFKMLYKTLSLAHHLLVIYYFPYFAIQ